MGRTLGFLSLTCALALCPAAQTVNTTVTPGYATVGQPTSGALPIPAPPELALPGSGTPVGVPPNVDVNNARTNSGGAVVQPGVSDFFVGGQPLAVEPRIVTAPIAITPAVIPMAPAEEGAAGAETTGNAGTGQQQGNAVPVFGRVFVNGNANASGQPTSLGELAAQLRGRKPLPKRTFDNEDIVALSRQAPAGLRSQREDLPQSDQPATTSPKKTPQPKQVRPKDQSGVLDPNDMRKVEEALRRSKQNQNTNYPK
jgi:hypothetical protein